jgi:hypothetical protein
MVLLVKVRITAMKISHPWKINQNTLVGPGLLFTRPEIGRFYLRIMAAVYIADTNTQDSF